MADSGDKRLMVKATDSFPVVVLADGNYPAGGIAAGVLNHAARVVCCDGAAAGYISRGGKPYAIVGDCDSLPPELRERFSGIIFSDPDQESNDLTKAVRFCLSKGFKDMMILGATGKREDHSLANIGLLPDYFGLCRGGSVRMVTDYGVFEVIDRDTCFESFPGMQVSLFCPYPRVRVTTCDLKYPLTGAHLTAWWQGSLNEAQAESFSILCDGPLIVFRTFDPKGGF